MFWPFMIAILCAMILIAIAAVGDDFIAWLARWYYGEDER